MALPSYWLREFALVVTIISEKLISVGYWQLNFCLW
ncbi:hypothetical protein EDC91_1502 [Shewanella fodinae]|uniref:Uncharacterized protein n=1 Tax=Shewanella fodinae TaxID=552357 RepID=A0A4R2F258_9GAMM|nr:hypothetical protein EDC91_1502 [Shewanella fodinae]